MMEEFKNKIFLGDCLELLKEIPNNSVDLVLTDPPYGISQEIKITRGRNTMKFKGTTDISLNFGEWDKFENKEECMKFTYQWIDLCHQVLRDGGMFITFFDRDKINLISHYLQDKYNYKMKGYFAYIKIDPVPQARKVKWMNAWEEAVLLQKPGGKLTYNYEEGQHPDYVIHTICKGKERTEHPTQKPLVVILPFIRWWTKPGDLVLDPFIGSGTTAIACIKLNRNYIGIEKDPKYFEICLKRIAEEKRQLKLPFS